MFSEAKRLFRNNVEVNRDWDTEEYLFDNWLKIKKSFKILLVFQKLQGYPKGIAKKEDVKEIL